MDMQTFQDKAVRHGEVIILPIDESNKKLMKLIGKVEEVYSGKEHVIGHSETGHHHVLVGDVAVCKPLSIATDPTLYKQAAEAIYGSEFDADGNRMWPQEFVLFKAKSDSVIDHRKTFDRHDTKDIATGWYVKHTKEVYDPFLARRRQSMD